MYLCERLCPRNKYLLYVSCDPDLGDMTKVKVMIQKSRGVCETLTMPPAATKSEKAIFRAKVKVKVTTSLTLVSFERASLVEYAYQI